MVHSSFTTIPNPDIILQVEIENRICPVFVLIRPGCFDFLNQLAEYYELVIYTASLSKYADPLMDQIDPKGLCSQWLFREHCTFYGGVFVKDISRVGRDPNDVILVDNSPNSYFFQPENALPIVSWYENMGDRILYNYI